MNYSKTNTVRRIVEAKTADTFSIDTAALPAGHLRTRIEAHLAAPAVREFVGKWMPQFASVYGRAIRLELAAPGTSASLRKGSPSTFVAGSASPAEFVGQLLNQLRTVTSRELSLEMGRVNTSGRYYEVGIIPPVVRFDPADAEGWSEAVASATEKTEWQPDPTSGVSPQLQRLYREARTGT